MPATLAKTIPKEQRAEIEREAWRLRVDGWTVERIAEKVGVHHSTVSRMLAAVEKRLADRFEKDAHRIKGRQTAQLEAMYDAAMEQFRRSCQDAEKVRTVTKRIERKPDAGERARDYVDDVPEDLDEDEAYLVESTREVSGQSGNPALLAQARGALADVRTIWGLDAPKRQELSGRDGAPIPISVVDAISKVYGDGDTPPDEDDEPEADEE